MSIGQQYKLWKGLMDDLTALVTNVYNSVSADALTITASLETILTARDTTLGYRDETDAHAERAEQALAGIQANTVFQDLAAVSNLLGKTVIAGQFYSPLLDDDPDWIFKCSHLSWYKERLGTEVRGLTRPHPAISYYALTTSRLIIYDLTGSTPVMWMTFIAGQRSSIPQADLTSVDVRNGVIQVGADGNSGSLSVIDFRRDESWRRPLGRGRFFYRSDLTARNDNVTTIEQLYWPNSLVNRSITALASTGMRELRTAIGTKGGTSVINPDGSVTNISGGAVSSVDFDAHGRLIIADNLGVASGPIPTADTRRAAWLVGELSARTDAIVLRAGRNIVVSDDAAIEVIRENPSSVSTSLAATITTAVNTGFVRKDAILATLMSTDITTLAEGSLTAYVGADIDVAGIVTRTPITAGGEKVWFELSDAITVTLSSDISGSGTIEWWEESGGVPRKCVSDLSGGQSYVNGRPAPAVTRMTVSGADLTIPAGVKLADLRVYTAGLTAQQVASAYEEERKTLSGAVTLQFTGAVTGQAYDAQSELTYFAQAGGVTIFSTLGVVGTIAEDATNGVDVHNGMVTIRGAADARLMVPPLNLRAELQTVPTHAPDPAPVIFEGDGETRIFALPDELKPVSVFNADNFQLEGEGEDYEAVPTDFPWQIIFAVPPASGNRITVTVERI